MINKKNYSHINLEYIYDIADGEDDFVTEIVNNCLEAIGPNLKKLSAAIMEGDEQTTTFLAHKLNGSFKFIGCNEAGNIAALIEEKIKKNEPIAAALALNNDLNERYQDIERELILFLNELNA